MNADLPALLGGLPVRSQGPPDWPAVDEEVHAALEAAWRDGSWGKYQADRVAELEQLLARYHEVAHALTCGSGTFAVELALRALKVGSGDEVLLAAYDYPGNFLSVHAVGARPVLIDVQPKNWNLDPERLAEACTPATKAILVSHLHGGLVPMPQICQIAREHRLRVVEDACQCPGALIEGRRAGTWGDAGVLSFGGSKLLTAGRGGTLLTPHADVLQRARLWQNRANVVCPLSELQAAVLLPQLKRLDERNTWRLEQVRRLEQGISNIPGLQLLAETGGPNQPAFYKLGFRFEEESFGIGRARFLAALRAEGIAFDEGFRALHVGRSPSRFRHGSALTEAERAHHGCVILHHPVLLGRPSEINEVVRAIRKVWTHREQLR